VKIDEIVEKTNSKKEDFEKKKKELGQDQFNQVCRFINVRVLDMLWQEHLSNMDHMRDAVRLRAYGGKDPLVEYKSEGRRMFKHLLDQMDFEIADNILRAGVQIQPQKQPRMVEHLANQSGQVSNTHNPTPNTHIGRNDPCPCGSGKKYKKCHGK